MATEAVAKGLVGQTPAPDKRSWCIGSKTGTPLSNDMRCEITSLLLKIHDKVANNHIRYSSDYTACDVDFQTGGADQKEIVNFIDKFLKTNYENDMEIIHSQIHGQEMTIYIKMNKYSSSMTIGYKDKKFREITKDAEDFIEKSCVAGELRIPSEVKSQLKMEIVEKVISAGLPGKEQVPELYRNRPLDHNTNKPEHIVKFLERVWYDPWIAAGVFTRNYLRKSDPSGEQALQNWLRDDQNVLPFSIPTKSDLYDQKIGDVAQARAAWRMATAAHRRRDSFDR